MISGPNWQSLAISSCSSCACHLFPPTRSRDIWFLQRAYRCSNIELMVSNLNCSLYPIVFGNIFLNTMTVKTWYLSGHLLGGSRDKDDGSHGRWSKRDCTTWTATKGQSSQAIIGTKTVLRGCPVWTLRRSRTLRAWSKRCNLNIRSFYWFYH